MTISPSILMSSISTSYVRIDQFVLYLVDAFFGPRFTAEQEIRCKFPGLFCQGRRQSDC